MFPHYWTTLTAATLLRLPEGLRTTETDRIAHTILHATMANYFADGSAACAYVMPSSAGGRKAHLWHLVMWMRSHER